MKIKLRESIRYFLRIYVLLSLLFLGISISFYITANKARHSAFKAQEILNIKQQEEIIRHDIQAIASDLTVLSEHHYVRELHFNDSNFDWRRVADNFLVFVRNKKRYDQLRFIDSIGMEQIRVNWNHGKPKVVPSHQLQNKSKRYYFLDTMDLEKGEIFVSPFDLNIENGEVEEPKNPMIRFATPVFKKDGEKSGMVILNFLGDNLLKDLANLGNASVGNILMLNQNGFYFRATKAEDEWGFMFPGKENKNFSHHYPRAWKEISTQDSGQFVTPKGLFSFTTIHPLFEGLQSSTGSPEAFARSAAHLSSRDYVWKLMSHVPPRVLRAHQYPYLVTYIVANAILLVVIGVGCWLAANAECKRKEAELELKDEREKFRTVADFTHAWEYWLRPDDSYVYTSPSCERITGYSAQAFQEDPGLLLKLVHPDDLQKMSEHINTKHAEKDACYMDFRITTAAGEEKWISHFCQAIYGDDGRFLGRRASNRDISLRKQAELELENLATHDVLTNLPNRRLLYDRLAQIIAQAQRDIHKVAILFIDLDDFKQINDELGHDAGDIVLQQTARRMADVLRQGDTVARMGGDEFVVVLPNIKGDAAVNGVTQKLIDAIGQAIQVEAHGEIVNQHIGASIGISTYPVDGLDIDSLISTADKAMYLAKKAGRNQYSRLAS